jgi:hypothetical protein
MNSKLALIAMLVLSSSAFAADTTITDFDNIMDFLSKHPKALAVPAAATFASGFVTKVTSITYGECLANPHSKDVNKEMKVTIEMQSNDGPSGRATSVVSCAQ